MRTFEVVHTVSSHVNAPSPEIAEALARAALGQGTGIYLTEVLEGAEVSAVGEIVPF